MQYRYALGLTRIKKANAFDIDEIHFFQIQSCSRSATFNLGLDLINVLRSKLPAQPNPWFALTRNPFNLQRHGFSGSKAQSYECNYEAIHNFLRRCDLELLPILNFEEFLYGEENARSINSFAAIDSAGLLNFEPKFVDSQAFDF